MVDLKNLKCRLCKVCDGRGCVGEMPGMGGLANSAIFQANFDGWRKFRLPQDESGEQAKVRLAPMANGTMNFGWDDERDFYVKMTQHCVAKGIPISLGDGVPDTLLLFGLEAVRAANQKCAVFAKPFENAKIFERWEWAGDVAEIVGVDADAVNIVTMRNLAHLEEKTAPLLADLQRGAHKMGLPFAIKGIFTKKDLQLVAEAKPDIAIVSNHGGRVENEVRSTADFLAENADFLRKHCGEVWVDGGLREGADFAVAKRLGASCALIGRPILRDMAKSLVR